MTNSHLANFKYYTKNNCNKFIEETNFNKNCITANLLATDSKQLISNVTAQFVALTYQGHVWPVSLNSKAYNNAVVCSPFTTYVTYPLDILNKFNKAWIKATLLFGSPFLNLLFKSTKLNNVVQINNTYDSLLRHSKATNDHLTGLTTTLSKKFSKHAILFFRVNEKLDKDLLLNLKNNNYLVFPDRIVHLFDNENDFIQRSNTKHDLKLLKRNDYQIVSHEDIQPDDIPRICKLYQVLFVEKYSKHNAIYTEEFFRKSINNHWHHYKALRNQQGIIDAFISWSISDNIMTCGPLGHDTKIDCKVGLYRRVVALALKYAHEKNKIFNMGGGSEIFKLNRGSKKTFEYTAVYCQHLPLYRHLPWRLIKLACDKLLIKIFNTQSL